MAQNEALVLDTLALNDGTTFTMEALDMSVPNDLEEWVKGADSDGALLARFPTVENRVITASLRIEPQSTMDLALAKIGLIVDKLQEAKRNTNGVALTWVPADATLPAITFRCLSGQITGLPIDITSGWLVKAPLITIKLTCLPFGEGAEVTSYINEATNPSFEVNTTGWAVTGTDLVAGGTLTRVTAQHFDGVAAGQLVTTATASAGANLVITGPFIAGQPLTFSVYLKGNAGGETMEIGLVDSPLSQGVNTPVTLTNGWVRYSTTYTPTTTWASAAIVVRTASATIRTVFIDAVMLTRGTTAPTYFDGATGTGYAWFGTAHASKSGGPNAVASTDPIVTLELTGVPGDVPATGRLVVTDGASQSRRYVPWGLESRWYPTSSPPSLTVDSANMVTSGYAGGAGTVGGTAVVVGTLRPQLQALCALGNLTHVGAFRVLARFYVPTPASTVLRLAYQAGDGPFRSLPWQLPVVTGWNMIDLGQVTIPQTVVGSQKWTGRIEAYSTAGGSELLSIDFLVLMPAEQFGRAVASYAYQPGLLVARDDFNGRTAGAALNGTAMQAGAGNWATSGSATDLGANDAPAATDETIARATTADSGPRYAIAGSATPTDIEVGIDTIRTANSTLAAQSHTLIARWTDSTHYLSFALYHFGIFNSSQWQITYWNGTQSAGLASSLTAAFPLNSVIGMRMVVYASGAGHAWIIVNGVDFEQIDFADATLATGGALASGKSGFADYNPSGTAITRYYDNFYTATPAAEPVCCYSGQSIEFRSDTTLREDSTGTYAGPPPQYTGGRFFLPNAGGPARKTRVAFLGRRNNVESATDDFIADNTVGAVSYTPRYLVVPR